MKLYELTKAWTRIREELDLLDDPDEVASFTETLDAITGDIQDKAESIAVLIKELNYEALALREEEKTIAQRRKSLENRAESLERYLMGQMVATGVGKVTGSKASVTLARTPDKVVIRCIEALKAESRYWKPYKYDESNLIKTAIKEAIEYGDITPDVATLESGTTLRIK